MKNSTRMIIEKIEKNKIKPRKKIYFTFLNIFMSIGVLGALFLSGLTFSAAVFFAANHGLVNRGLFLVLFLIALIFVLLVFYVSYLFFIRIKKAHRTPIQYVLGFGIIIIFTAGILFAQNHFYAKLDNLAQSWSLFSFQEHVERSWSEPEKNNQLAIEVIYIDEDAYVYGLDFRGDIHAVDTLLLEEKEKEIFLRYLMVGMYGQEHDGVFYPEEVFPWRFKYKQKRHHPGHDKIYHNDNIEFIDF